jgi:pectate lyase
MKKTVISIIILLMGLSFYAQQLAFPTAEGYGKYTVGGRGGKVFEVTNLNDSGEGSLRAAVEASGPRTVVFKISGTIELEKDLRIKNPNITIAGQTAPGDGICLKKSPLVIGADNVIIRYLRVRLGNESGEDADAISSRFTKNLILDHVSASWSVDETMSIYHGENVTVQWCLISESMFNSNHIKGAHGFGGIWGSNYSSYHHNLIADHSSRNVRFSSGSGYTDYRNNVIYNWGYQSSYGGEQQQVGDSDPNHSFTEINMVANYYKPGPATQPGNVTYRIVNPSYRDVKTDYGKWYVADNFMEGNPEVTANNWNGGVQPRGGDTDKELIKASKPWPAMAINQQTAQEAYKLVLDNAGAILPKRDAVDMRVVSDARKGIATFEGATYKQLKKIADTSKTGIIDSPNDVGGWPELKSTPALIDTDHDGMPDAWEKSNGLNPSDPSDGNKIAKDGYTMLEVYLNSIN